jgi:hypothetical protein
MDRAEEQVREVEDVFNDPNWFKSDDEDEVSFFQVAANKDVGALKEKAKSTLKKIG